MVASRQSLHPFCVCPTLTVHMLRAQSYRTIISMASSSTSNIGDIQQLKALLHGGYLSTVEFLSMSRELTDTDRTNRQRFEGRATDDGEEQLSVSDADGDLVGEDGNLLSPAATPCPSPAHPGSPSAGCDTGSLATHSVPRTPPAGDVEGVEVEDGSAAAEEGTELSAEQPPPILESNDDFEFKVGAPVIIHRAGNWPGMITAIGRDSENFLTYRKYQVRYDTPSRKGRGFTTTTVQAWVEVTDLKQRVVSPRKAQKVNAGPSAGSNSVNAGTSAGSNSVAATRPHMRQPGFEKEDAEGGEHPGLAKHERGRKLTQRRKTKETNVPIPRRLSEFSGQSFMMDTINKTSSAVAANKEISRTSRRPSQPTCVRQLTKRRSWSGWQGWRMTRT